MREVKFEVMFWLYGRDFTKSVAKHYTTLDRLTNGEDSFDYSSVEVVAKRQYTGLKDKNGVEIYEGDIVKGFWYNTDNHESLTCAVEYEAPYFSPFGSCKGDHSGMLYGTSIYPEDFEVIGNIYENSELLDD